jgi:Lon protease-like protein
MNILVEGGERFRLDELTDGRSFETGHVTPLEDEEDAADATAVEDAMRVFGMLREVTGSDVEPPDPVSPQLSYELAGKVELAPGEKLALLREVSERRRMELVQQLLEHAVLAAQRVRRAADRATTNGRVDLG